MGQAAHRVGREAHALFIGEGDQRERAARDHAGIGERLAGFEAGQHAVEAVVTAAGPDGVDVRAEHHRRRILAPATHAEDVADRVDGDGQAELAHPLHQQVAPGPVLVAEREPAIAAAGQGADPIEGVEPGEQAVEVDARRHPACHARSCKRAQPTARCGKALSQARIVENDGACARTQQEKWAGSMALRHRPSWYMLGMDLLEVLQLCRIPRTGTGCGARCTCKGGSWEGADHERGDRKKRSAADASKRHMMSSAPISGGHRSSRLPARISGSTAKLCTSSSNRSSIPARSRRAERSRIFSCARYRRPG